MNGPAVGTPLPRMADDDRAIRDGIGALWPQGVVDETPQGRLAGIDRDTWLTYREMHELLTSPPHIDPVAYVQHLQDLSGVLVDLHKRGVQAFEEIRAQQMEGSV